MENDLSLINNIKENNSGVSLLELIERHSGMYVHIVDKYIHKNSYVSRDLIIDDKDFVIYQSALEYNPEKKSKFSTFLANQTKWKCLNAINNVRNKNNSDIELADKEISKECGTINLIEKIEAFDCFHKALNEESDKRVKKIIDIRYNTDNNRLNPWRKVSKELNLSIQGCINIHNRFINKVKKQLDNINYV